MLNSCGYTVDFTFMLYCFDKVNGTARAVLWAKEEDESKGGGYRSGKEWHAEGSSDQR